MDGELVKRVSEHMFPKGVKDLNSDDEMITLMKCFEPTDEKLDEILNDDGVKSSKIKASVGELKKQRAAEKKLKNEQKGQYNKFVEGSCNFTERTFHGKLKWISYTTTVIAIIANTLES